MFSNRKKKSMKRAMSQILMMRKPSFIILKIYLLDGTERYLLCLTSGLCMMLNSRLLYERTDGGVFNVFIF